MLVEAVEFEGDDLLEVRSLVAAGRLVLLPSDAIAQPDRLPEQYWARTIAESVGESAVVPLSCLRSEPLQVFPLLVGPKEAIRLLCGYADELAPEPFPLESMPLRTHYRQYRDLWMQGQDQMQPDLFMLQIGMRMGDLHARNILHGDAHLGNWGMIDAQVVIADPEPVFLLCPPTPQQCATDLHALMPDLQPNHWLNVRTGYRSEWPEGFRTIDVIQLGDLNGWAVAFRTQQYTQAIALMGEQLHSEQDPRTRMTLLLNTVVAKARSGVDAWSDHREATSLAEAHTLPADTALGIAEAFIAIGEGDLRRAENLLRVITRDPKTLVESYSAPDAQVPITNM